MITRRKMLRATSGALAAGAWTGGLCTRVMAAGAGKEIVTLSDGHLVLPADFLFAGMPEEELAKILAAHDVPQGEVEPPCNVTLLRDGDRVVLFDAGSGSGFMPTAGALLDTLYDLDIAPEDVTDVIFTHAHPDHLWGVLDDFDDLAFPEAAYHMGETEWAYWTDPNTVDTIGEARASFAVGAERRLAAIEERMTLFKDGVEVLPGIMAHATFGHTPGHMSFEIATDGDPVLVAGDVIGNSHVAFEKPGWASGSDQDGEMGVQARLRVLDMAATDKMRVIGYHLPDGGMGRVERAGDAYRFVGEDA